MDNGGGAAVMTRLDWSQPQHCAVCDREMRPVTSAPDGRILYGAGGACTACYARKRRYGTYGYARSLARWDSYADDYDLLRSEGYPLDVIAARLGMSVAALDRALRRHADDPRARRPRRTA